MASVLVLGFFAFRALVSRPVDGLEAKTASSIPASLAPVEQNRQLGVKEYRLPQISVEEFTAPNFASASPAHKEAMVLGDLKNILLKFSVPLAAPSKIIVLAGNKVVAAGGEISADGTALNLSFAGGAFTARNLQTGIYEVYYDACFAGDACYKGQHAFYGIQ